MGQIVYHGTFSHNAPHLVDQPTFHAGTKQSAKERLWEAEALTKGGIATVHGYEINENAPMSRSKWSDPHIDERNPHDPLVPENETSKIYPYTNEYEDVGSTSYVIPRGFVKSGHVRYLGPQFQSLEGPFGEKIGNAVTVMVGGKIK